MRIVARKVLRECWDTEPDSRTYVQAWYVDLKQALWTTPEDIARTHRNVGWVPTNRLAFLLNKTAIRAVVSVNFVLRLVYIHFVGPHWKTDPIQSRAIVGDVKMSSPISSEANYLELLQALEAICGPNPPAIPDDEVEKLIQQVIAYEDEHYGIPKPGRFDALAYFMESRGISPKDMEP